MLDQYLFFYIILFISFYKFNSATTSFNDCITSYNQHCFYYDSSNEYYYVFSGHDEQSGIIDTDIELPQIIVSETFINKLKAANGDNDIIIGRVFKKYTDTNINNEITDIIGYSFYYINGAGLTLISSTNVQTTCGNEVITYYLPIYTDDNSLKNKYINVIRQNPDYDEEDTFIEYDIFNPNADIYNDICATITFSDASENVADPDSFTNYDITLHERRKYYYPGNSALCPEGFTYKGIDKETFSSMCQTKLNSEISKGIIAISNPPLSSTSHTFSIFKADNDFQKKKKDIYFSMDVFKCIKLPFTSKGFKGNYGSYFILVLMFIVIACYLILLLTGKHHLLSVLELLFNSNINSMSYLKQNNNSIYNNNTAYNNQLIPYDIRSNNNFISGNQTLASNGQLLSNMLVSNNNLYYPNSDKKSISKKSNNNTKKAEKEKEKEKKEIMSNVDEQENDFESEKGNEEKDKDKTFIKNNDNKDVIILKVKEKEADLDKNLIEKEKEKEKEEKISKNSSKSKKEEEEEEDDDEENESEEESESNKSNKDKIQKTKEKNDKDDKANPPKKNGGQNNNENEEEEEENGKKEKKRKSKNPIEIALNVKDLRNMMFKEQKENSESIKPSEQKEEKKSKSQSKSKEEKTKPKSKKKNKNNNNNTNNNNNNYNPNNFNNSIPPPNNFPFPYFPPPMGMMPPYGMPPGYPSPYAPNGASPPQNLYHQETQNLKKELEYQKELNERRDREMRREREDMLERERERQRQREFDMERERRLRDMEMMYGNKNEMGLFQNMPKNKNAIKRGSALWNDDSDLILREREKFNKEQDKFDKIKEKLEDEIEKKKEENEKIIKDLNLAKEEQKVKQMEYEKELLKNNQELKEQFEKEKKEIIDTKNKEMEILKQDKDREIQILKEDKDREINILKQEMETKIKKKDNTIKKKEKVIEKQKRQTNELKKDLTTNNTFYTNNNASTFRYNCNSEMNNIYKKEEKIDTPQVVVSINSIFTDQELNSMDFEQSCQYDKRSLCQVYLSYINRKQPLFFFFNYNSSSSGISIFQINYQTIRFIIICIDFMIYLFIYCTFFGTKSISLIYQRKYNFRLMCILGIIISPFCLIIRSVIHHFIYDPMNKRIAEIKIRCYTNFTVGKKKQEMKINEFKDFWESDGDEKNKGKEEMDKKDEMDEIQDIENDENISEEEKAKRKDKFEKRKLKQLIKDIIALFQKKILISFPIMIVGMFVIWIYVSCFCAVYKNSQLKFFVSILVCYGFSNLIPFVYCLVPTIFRQDGVRDESRFSFFIAYIFQII